MGIRSVVCLLDERQVDRYSGLPGGLLEYYRQAGLDVGHVPVPDMQTPAIPSKDLEKIGRLFDQLPKPVLVHCWAGVDRTGAAVEYLSGRLGA
jgi:protein tyrosine phosphatase (PTP) superfamily phosphohydrolase (DUF442 family)